MKFSTLILVGLLWAGRGLVFPGEVTLDFPPPGQDCPRTRVTFTTPVDLGTVGVESLSGELLGAADVVVLLESRPVEISVVREGDCDQPPAAEIYIQLLSLIGPVRPEAFSWKGGDQPDYAPFPRPGEWMHLAALSPEEGRWTGGLSFRYAASLTDPPGAYGVRLRFKVEYPDLPTSLRELYSAEWELVAAWSLEELTVLLVHGPVSLGTIGPGIYRPGMGFGSLEAAGNPVLLATNRMGELLLSVRGLSASFPLEFSGGATALWSDFYLRADGGMFSSPGEGEVQLGELVGPGWHRYLVDYLYQADEGDVPGEYGVILEYTVSTP